MKFDIILQCRTKSKRLPNKIFYKIGKSTILEILISNLKKINQANKIIIAVSFNDDLKKFRKIAKKNNVDLFVNTKGINENDVLSRFYNCSKKYKSENIIRITPDCPFINIEMVKNMINFYKKKKLLFLTNNKPRYVPHGFDCEIIHYSILKSAKLKSKSKYEREHVTPWIYKNYFKNKNNIKIINKDYSNIRITIDILQDYLFFLKNDKLLKKISTEKNFIKNLKKLEI